MKVYDVLTFGEAMGMFIAEEPGQLASVRHFTKELAGAETNVAIGLSRLGYRVLWLSKVGTDPLGDYIIQELQREKVDTSLIKRDEENLTGFQLKEKVSEGDPGVYYYRKNSAASLMGIKDFPELGEIHAKHYHLTGIPLGLSPCVRELTEAFIQKAKKEGSIVSFDPNLRPSMWKDEKTMAETIQRYACQADIVFPGIKEGKILTGYQAPEDIANDYLERGAKMVFVKLGAKGAYVATEKKAHTVPGFPVTKVVDTVGAGDGFAAGVLSGLFDGLTAFEAAERGNAIGALQTMSSGDKNGLPTREELLAFMNGHSVKNG